MSDQQTCPYCDADADYAYKCGTDKYDPMLRGIYCYRREIAQKDAEIEKLKNLLQEIAELAHNKSTGLAIPDVYWEIRRMAYDAIEVK